MKSSFVKHTLKPVCEKKSKILILGTMPSPKSRETGFYYGHPQNRFWKTLAGVFNTEAPETIEEKKAFLSNYGIALWDVLSSCQIMGASDASIKNYQYNDIDGLLKEYPNIRAVFTTGKKAEYFLKKSGQAKNLPKIGLPSTSPANARFRLDNLIEAYRVILNYGVQDDH